MTTELGQLMLQTGLILNGERFGRPLWYARDRRTFSLAALATRRSGQPRLT